MAPNRRDVLGLAGSAAAILALGSAGRAAADGWAQDDLPAYSRWLTLGEGELEFDYVDWATIEGFAGDELEEAEVDETIPAEYEGDPMIAPLSEGLLSTYLFVGTGLGRFRLGRLLEAEAFESTVEGLLRTDDAFVVTGTMERGEIVDALTAEPEIEFIVQTERTGEIDRFDVYTPVEGDVDAAIGLGDDALAVVDAAEAEADDDPVAILERTLGAWTGDVERATDASADVEWLVEAGGRGDVAVGQYGGPFDAEELRHPSLEGLGAAEGFVSSFVVEDEETLTGEFASIVDEPDEEALGGLLGASANERSIDVQEDRVTASATWRDEERPE